MPFHFNAKDIEMEVIYAFKMVFFISRIDTKCHGTKDVQIAMLRQNNSVEELYIYTCSYVDIYLCLCVHACIHECVSPVFVIVCVCV